jgi:Rab3 GTPase-activating protein regulatory subunit N-terminus
MSLTDVVRLKELINLNSIKDEWIQESKIVCSPLDDFIVVASTTSAAFYVKKYVASKPEFQLCRLFRPTSSSLSISAISYLPVKVEKQGRSSDLWHCVVIGYSNGK